MLKNLRRRKWASFRSYENKTRNIKGGKLDSLSGLIDPASHLNWDYPDHKVTTCVITEKFSVGAPIRFSGQGLSFAIVNRSSFTHYGSIDYTQRLARMIDAVKEKKKENAKHLALRRSGKNKTSGRLSMININSIVGNIRNDENLTVKYRVMTENRLSEIVQISRTEAERVRMRKTSNKGNDVAITLPPECTSQKRRCTIVDRREDDSGRDNPRESRSCFIQKHNK